VKLSTRQKKKYSLLLVGTVLDSSERIHFHLLLVGIISNSSQPRKTFSLLLVSAILHSSQRNPFFLVFRQSCDNLLFFFLIDAILDSSQRKHVRCFRLEPFGCKLDHLAGEECNPNQINVAVMCAMSYITTFMCVSMLD
jgi:hypothetical protein